MKLTIKKILEAARIVRTIYIQINGELYELDEPKAGTLEDLKNNIDFLYYHNKNLTKAQYNAIDAIRDTINELF